MVNVALQRLGRSPIEVARSRDNAGHVVNGLSTLRNTTRNECENRGYASDFSSVIDSTNLLSGPSSDSAVAAMGESSRSVADHRDCARAAPC